MFILIFKRCILLGCGRCNYEVFKMLHTIFQTSELQGTRSDFLLDTFYVILFIY
jgi:hypothetical protein